MVVSAFELRIDNKNYDVRLGTVLFENFFADFLCAVSTYAGFNFCNSASTSNGKTLKAVQGITVACLRFVQPYTSICWLSEAHQLDYCRDVAGTFEPSAGLW